MRLTATERDALVRMFIALDILTEQKEALKARAGTVPGARRDLAMIAAKAAKLIDAFTKTVPPEQVTTFVNSLKLAGYTIGVKAPGKATRDDKNYGTWISYEALGVLLEGCKDHCFTCGLDLTGRRACRLRKTLDAIPNDTKDRPDGECPYFYVM